MDYFTKKVGWTVSQRRFDGLFHRAGWVDCLIKKVG